VYLTVNPATVIMTGALGEVAACAHGILYSGSQ